MDRIGNITADFEGHGFYKDGKEIMLLPQEAILLKLLWDNYGHGVSRLTIAETIWGDQFRRDHGIYSTVNRLRGKVGKTFIQTQSGYGYRIAPSEDGNV